jgi:hypothetical protein
MIPSVRTNSTCPSVISPPLAHSLSTVHLSFWGTLCTLDGVSIISSIPFPHIRTQYDRLKWATDDIRSLSVCLSDLIVAAAKQKIYTGYSPVGRRRSKVYCGWPTRNTRNQQQGSSVLHTYCADVGSISTWSDHCAMHVRRGSVRR